MLEELREQMLAEQAEQIARLQLRNEIRMAGLILWGILLLGWVIFCYVKFVKHMKNASAMGAGQITFTCESCGASFQASSDYVVRHPFIPKKTVHSGRTVRLSRRLSCPYCRKKTWCRQDMAETAQITGNSLRERGRTDLLLFLKGAVIIIAAGGIFSAALNIIF